MLITKRQTNRRHWSYSALNDFNQCARKYHAYKVAKTVKEPESPQMLEGKRVHQALADYISKGTPLSPQYARYAKHAPAKPHSAEQMLVEHEMALTFGLEPCEWFDKKKTVWLRAKADLLVISGRHAISIDWKTGKEPDPRYEVLPPNFQLRCVAVAIFIYFPQVQTIHNEYVYLNEDNSTSFIMERGELKEFIPQMYEYVGVMQRAFDNNHFPPRYSGLCKRHCAVTGCEHHGT